MQSNTILHKDFQFVQGRRTSSRLGALTETSLGTNRIFKTKGGTKSVHEHVLNWLFPKTRFLVYGAG